MNKLNTIIHCILALLLCLPYACSYEDKTTYAGTPLPDIVIDTTGIPVTHLITREDTLVIKPKVSKSGVSQDQLEFEWRLTLKPGEDFSMSKIIGTGKELKYYVEDIPDASSYGLWYKVKDKNNRSNGKYPVESAGRCQFGPGSGGGLHARRPNHRFHHRTGFSIYFRL